MVAQLRAKPGAGDIGVTIGDFARTTVDQRFTLAYLVRNTITNLTTQGEQVDCFRNAAAHLEPSGHFVIEVYIPELQRLPPGETFHTFTKTATHLGFEEYDVEAQIAVSHHYWLIDGSRRSPRPTAACGRPSSTSWRRWRGCPCASDGAAGTTSRSPPTAGATSPCGRGSASAVPRRPPWRGPPRPTGRSLAALPGEPDGRLAALKESMLAVESASAVRTTAGC
jgi:hypothetical protein